MSSRENDTTTHKVELELKIPNDWIRFVTEWTDGFIHGCYGYWARGIERENGLGWLVWVDDEKSSRGEEPLRDEALAALRTRSPMPKGWLLFDRDFAIRAYVEGAKRWGVDWYNGPKSDANRYDIAVQLAAFGEHRFG